MIPTNRKDIIHMLVVLFMIMWKKKDKKEEV